jgi:hypothetical protein
MPIVRISGFAEIPDVATFEKIKKASEMFAKENDFTFLEVSFEEKNVFKKKND